MELKDLLDKVEDYSGKSYYEMDEQEKEGLILFLITRIDELETEMKGRDVARKELRDDYLNQSKDLNSSSGIN